MIRRSGIALLAAACVLSACASERTFRPYDGEGDGEEDPTVTEDPPDTGGWGDWELGEVPDVAFALSVMNDTNWRTELVVVDLRGQILDRWQPPTLDDGGYPGEVTAIHALGPGEVMVLVGHGYAWQTDRGWGGGGPSQIWHGDLVTGTWTRRLHADPLTGQYVLDATDEVLPVSMWEGWIGASAVPWGDDPDAVLLSAWDGDCSQPFQQRVLGLDLSGEDAHRMWLVQRDWGDDVGMVWLMDGGLGADGEPAVFARTGTNPCEPGGSWSWTQYASWAVDAGETHAVLPNEGTHLESVKYDLVEEVALVARPSDTGEAMFTLTWEGAELPTTTLDANHVRPLAILDAEHGAALVASQYGTGFDELVIVAGGREVWRIEQLKDGLGKRDIQLWTGAMVEIP